ncbi:SDR family oxidoreductase [Aeoliella mucimassa]|uniref:3-oxoacyl-[acyl-carrier-protein] reductase FabG n=1 Tax=Aeoliella mucimassa TaxID=2527972 RepID=A0A518AIA3_9BACT|nr:SDR family oxidoreductase [Aeoliella mucimassa]QDU54471.1 3-oxoacyl-[acyl-carrier-protein] reductase FabG [Aeoliella mucimassa]
MPFAVKDKVALVTGANRGIGRTIVDTLIAAGVKKVYAAVRKPDAADPLVDAYGRKIAPLRIDLDDPATIVSAAETASDVELVINNAGVLRQASALADDAVEQLQYEMNVNVYGLMRMAHAFAPVLKANGGGALVQVNSVASLRSFPPFATYCASKAASYSITQALQVQLAEQGTQVLSVHPGPIATDMADDAGLQDMAEPPTLVSEGIVAALAAGDYHLFPDTMAKQLWSEYESFAKNVVEARGSEG